MTKNTIIPITQKKKTLLLLLLALLGILLMLLSRCGEDKAGAQTQNEPSALDPALYAEQIEEKVEALCNKIDGVSSAHAVVTLKGGYRAIYATDAQYGSSVNKSETVLIGSGSSEKALLIGYENPEIAGIGIVCSGGDDAYVRAEIISMISAAFDLGSNKIFVSGT
ncbi:MAG: hypothetical protein IJW52_05380 [Clostridia bacterium]|nr:hypothetical protein [Clostridia bacterium]